MVVGPLGLVVTLVGVVVGLVGADGVHVVFVVLHHKVGHIGILLGLTPPLFGTGCSKICNLIGKMPENPNRSQQFIIFERFWQKKWVLENL